MSEVSSESDPASSEEEGEVKEEKLVEEGLEYESDSSYHAPPVGPEVIILVPIEEEDESVPLASGSVCSGDLGDIRLPPSLKKTKFLFR